MESLRNEIAKRVQQERSEYDRLMASVEQLYAQGALASESPAQSVYVEGASNLVLSGDARSSDCTPCTSSISTHKSMPRTLRRRSAYRTRSFASVA